MAPRKEGGNSKSTFNNSFYIAYANLYKTFHTTFLQRPVAARFIVKLRERCVGGR